MNSIPIPKIGYAWQGVGCWRNVELLPYVFQRESWHCKVCWRTDISAHEGIITRSEFMGIRPRGRQILFYHPYNTIALCSVHHNTELEPTKQQVFEWMIEYYGKENVIDWLREISKEFKVVPPFVRQSLA